MGMLGAGTQEARQIGKGGDTVHDAELVEPPESERKKP
jgi:hypothetical protein